MIAPCLLIGQVTAERRVLEEEKQFNTVSLPNVAIVSVSV